MVADSVAELVRSGGEALRAEDPMLHAILAREQQRQLACLSLVAASSVIEPSVLAAQASAAVNVTAEGYPGRRFHGGCSVVDEIESLAVERAKAVFGARYANVQPHSATTANYSVLSTVMRPGDTLLGMGLQYGGHLTHGSSVTLSGNYFHAVGYGLTSDGAIDYKQVRRLALEHRPKVIICGATAYPRLIDFARFREIADEVDAVLLADISHTAGLVAAGVHPSPVDHAHITTACTHKQLFGPRGGIIMSGRDSESPAPRGSGTLADFLQRAVFPFSQGAPVLNTIAAKARAFGCAATPEFRAVAERILTLASVISGRLHALGHCVVTGGTDNHIVLVDLRGVGLTGVAAERALERCGIIVNKNRVPGDTRPAHVTSGIRIGTNGIARRGFGVAEAVRCADLIDLVLRRAARDGEHAGVPEPLRETVTRAVAELCAEFPIPGYPAMVSTPDCEVTSSAPSFL